MVKIKENIQPFNETEEKVINDLEFQKGVQYGKPRPGHPEGKVLMHIIEVLKNIEDKFNENKLSQFAYADLRFIAIVHDSFKYKVDKSKPKNGNNHHAVIAKNFANKFINNKSLLQIIENHDEAYNAYNVGAKKGKWKKAEERANFLIDNMIDINLFFIFYECDNNTGNKSNENVIWFKELCQNKGLMV